LIDCLINITDAAVDNKEQMDIMHVTT